MGDFKETLNNYSKQTGEEPKFSTYYKCAICGRGYKNLEDRIACETKCLKKRTEDEAAMKKQKLEAEKKARMDEINAKYKELESLVQGYLKDYGAINLSSHMTFPKLPMGKEFWF